MTLRFTYLALALLALTCGCAIYHPQPLSPERAAAQLTARSLHDEELRRFMAQNLGHAPTAWPVPQWDLGTLTLAAWYFHPDMAVARAQVAMAWAEKKVAGERPEPGVSFSPQYTSNPADLSPWTLGYALDLPWETAGKRAKRVAAATAGERSAGYQLAAVAWQVRSHLRTALVSLWAARETTTWLDRQLADESALYALLERRLTAGEIASIELAQAHMTLEQVRLSAQDAHKQLQLARVGLAQAIGVPGQALGEAQIDFHDVVEEPSWSRLPPADELQKQALQARPDILAALADYDTAEANLRLEIARQYPDINFGPGYTWDQGAKRWSLGVNLTLPVFNRNRGAIARAEAGRAASHAKFYATQTRILGDLESARASFQSGCESLRAADEMEHQQQVQLAAAQSRFDAGDISRLEFLQACAQHDEAAVARVNSLVQAQASFAALEDAVQRPLDGTAPASPAFPPPET